ncbi:MAG: fatty acid desaturase [Vicinamibacteria bacterium]|nr:fatty acid desaturase [Vicinamibacteria bacterium]
MRLPCLRSATDLQSLVYLFAQPALAAWQWQEGFSPLGLGAMLFLAVGVTAVNHNHTHLPMWRSGGANRLTDLWLSLVQGHPGFVFFPTHIGNHHRHKHGPRDEARTYRFGGDHNHLLGFLLHPFQALPKLLPLIMKWFWRTRTRSPFLFMHYTMQFGVVGLTWLMLGSISLEKLALYVLLPQLFGVHFLLATNYLQHAHASFRGGLDYARNFEGWVNVLLFNIGLHTAHHEHPTLHWSRLPERHAEYRGRVDPRLIEPSFGGYVARTYLGALFLRRLRSEPLTRSAGELP